MVVEPCQVLRPEHGVAGVGDGHGGLGDCVGEEGGVVDDARGGLGRQDDHLAG